MDGYATHEVLNQAGPLHDVDLFSTDRPLCDAVQAFGAGWAADHLRAAGAVTGSARVQELARQANRFPPELRTHDRFGHRADVVEFLADGTPHPVEYKTGPRKIREADDVQRRSVDTGEHLVLRRPQ